ncbi:peptidase [Myxococcus sp. CA033]|uniref:M36 family metallopeptidase n=1 Tax=Myxococcus sp. CA033 TaxID=2741516 RepID=UPI00157B2661|nr:peptidase [Myxococcus sp. CA033]
MAKSLVSSVPTVVWALAIGTGCAVELPTGSAPDPSRQVGSAAALPSVAVVSRDVDRNTPTLVWAERATSRPNPSHDTPEAAARAYLEQQAPLYGLSPADLRAAYVHRVHDIGRGGIIVFFRQRVAGLEVVRNELKVLLTRDLALVGLTGHLSRGVERAQQLAGSPLTTASPRQSPGEAVLSALGDMYGQSLAGEVHEVRHAQAGGSFFDFVPDSVDKRSGVSLVTPARVRQVYVPVRGQLLPAYSVELLAERAGDEHPRGHGYLLHVEDGRVLHRRDRVMADAFTYRVWADANGVPLDSPQDDYTPHPKGEPDGREPGFTQPIQVSAEGLVHPGTLQVDPWLPAGATRTAGNNVWAYADHYSPDGFSEGPAGKDAQAFVTPGTRDFPHEYDTSAAPLASQTQTSASVVQLFYTTNWLHDYFYLSGFDEQAGNAQTDNLNRGGEANDRLLAEAQNQGPDARARNNAFAFVPSDGVSPRLEFYLWETPEVRAFSGTGFSYTTGKAAFGARDFNLQKPLVLADDGQAPGEDGCQPLVNANAEDAIIVVNRGGCTDERKAIHAEAALAAGLIVINHVPGAPAPTLFEGDPAPNPSLPVLSLSYEDGQALKALLAQGPSQGTMRRAASADRDGTLDNTIVAHEWGHVLFHRLAECSTPQCDAMSEGWSDFTALHLMLRENDNLDGTFAVGGFAAQLRGESSYFGVRRIPYSRLATKNALRFRHITQGTALPATHPVRANAFGNAQMHNAGEVWASMLFDGYLALVAQSRGNSPRIPSFAEARRRMADYVVTGMMLAPVDATFTEQRDALLMAAAAKDLQDMELLAQAFADRGAGSCAVSPPRDSVGFSGLVEAQHLQSDLRLEGVTLKEGARSCDNHDGVLDGAETGRIEVTVRNHGPADASSARVTVSNGPTTLLFPQGNFVTVDVVAPFSARTVSIPVELALSVGSASIARYDVTLDSATSCQTSSTQQHTAQLDYDLVPSVTDRVEGHRSTWVPDVLEGEASQTWRIQESPRAPGDRIWFAQDAFDFADTALQTPEMVIPAGGRFSLSFEHRHSFAYFTSEHTGVTDYWNGGVIEFTRNNGQTWQDVSTLVTAGLDYGGPLDTETGNNLGGRLAYVKENAAWPNTNTVTLDFGTRLQGSTVKLRFRLGSALALEAHGWEIDNITVQGATAPPFLKLAADVGTCHPRVVVGVDQTVFSGEPVTLDGEGSTDPNGDTLAFTWKQLTGPTVTLDVSDPERPGFTAPTVQVDTDLTFELTVSDAELSASAPVKVTVRPRPVVVDAGQDAGPDPEPDAGADAGSDAGTDAGSDAGTDAGSDAGTDAGSVPEPPKRPGEHTGCTSFGGGAGLAGPLGMLGVLLLMARRRRRS